MEFICWKIVKRSKHFKMKRLLWRCALLVAIATVLFVANFHTAMFPVLPGTALYAFFRPVKRISEEQIKQNRIDSNISDVIIQTNENRRRWVTQVCEKRNRGWNSSNPKDVLIAPSYSLSFCVVPKVGCTHWKRILRFIEKDYLHNDVIYPTDIGRMEVHYAQMTRVIDVGMRAPEEYLLIKPTVKFMFSRDPYAKVWSAYLDKYYLPDFWYQAAKYVVPKIRSNPSEKSTKCGHDVTFEEFVSFNYQFRNTKLNEHFVPTVWNCDPCTIDFDVLGKVESFRKDADLVLASVGLLGRIPEDKYLNQEITEIISLVEYNINIIQRLVNYNGQNRKCFDFVEICRRVWVVFQHNGYLGSTLPFPAETFLNIKSENEFKEKMIQTVINVRKATDTKTLKKWTSQREQSMRNAYNSLPKDLIENFKEMYSDDFEIFQYEKHPVWLKH